MISLGVYHGERMPGRDSGTAEPRKGLGTGHRGPGQSLGHPTGESGLICHKLGPENDEYSAHPNIIRMSRIFHDFTIVMHRRDEMIWEISKYSTGPVSQCLSTVHQSALTNHLTYNVKLMDRITPQVNFFLK
jgi:hypothetical protein